MDRRIPSPMLLFFAAVPLFSATAAPPPSPDGVAFFEKHVRPVLVEKCYQCHSRDAEKLKGDLYLDTRDGWQTGGDNGPALVPGDPDASLLIKAIRYTDEDLEMPPKEKLPPSAIAALEQWVAMGAPDPRTAASTAAIKPRSRIDLAKGREHWCFQPIRVQKIPAVKDEAWPNNEIDRFILAELEDRGLKPVAAADPASLLRRIHVDLTGLPPAPENVAARSLPSIEDRISKIENLIDELLASRGFGERWGRHWLDLARYADSSGGGASSVFPDAWEYRDYVIRSFNDDEPFDHFVTQQIAGDLITAPSVDERRDNLVATGFLALGPRNYINNDHEAFKMDGVDEQLDTVGRTLLGMTIGCARCHDHKFDPIPIEDYYALAGFFTSTESADPLPGTENLTWNTVADPLVDPDGSLLRAYEIADARYKNLRKELTRLKANANAAPNEIAALTQEVAIAKATVPKRPAVLMGVVDAPGDATGDCMLRLRGNPHRTGDSIPRGFLQAAFSTSDAARASVPAGTSGRLQLAQWITSPENPMTARVYVNRVWRHLMGEGIVRTVDNFGTTGDAPSHPELLDWLATWFRENGGSTKELVRLIVTSKTYQLGDAASGSNLIAADPSNLLLGRRTRRSLDAETMRDTILMAAGTLDLSPAARPFPASLKNEFDYAYRNNVRRSVYLPRFRNNLLELFETFDVANPATTVGRRDRTILPTQALYLMNNDFLIEQSRAAASRLFDDDDLSDQQRIALAYNRTLARGPQADELQLALDFLDNAAIRPEGDRSEDATLERWAAFQQSLFSCIDFRYMK